MGNQPALPGATGSGGTAQDQQNMRNYLSDTHMNLKHASVGQLQQRANAHQNWTPVENKMLDTTQQKLRDHTTSVFQTSAHMAHSERSVMAERAQQLRSQGAQGNDQLDSDFNKYTNTSRRQGSGAEYKAMADMLIHGKQGPLTMAQSAMGAEATVMGHQMLGKDYDTARVGAIRPTHPETGRAMHSTSSPTGLDLSLDPGTAERDKQGLPIMMGTSGSTSDMVRSFTHTQQKLANENSNFTPMSASTNRQDLKDLAFNWMRRGAPMENVRSQLSNYQQQQGQQKVTTPTTTATQTHTYPEIAAGVDLTIDGNTSANMQRSTTQAKQRMTQTKQDMNRPIRPTPPVSGKR